MGRNQNGVTFQNLLYYLGRLRTLTVFPLLRFHPSGCYPTFSTSLTPPSTVLFLEEIYLPEPRT